jgi:flagellar protein FliS
MTQASSQKLAQQYLRTQVESARPTQLVVMLYDGAIRFLTIAKEKMQAREIEPKHIHILKAQKILSELLGSLDAENGGEVAANLRRLYAYMLNRTMEANVYDRTEPLDEVISMLRELRASWSELDQAQARALAGAAA